MTGEVIVVAGGLHPHPGQPSEPGVGSKVQPGRHVAQGFGRQVVLVRVLVEVLMGVVRVVVIVVTTGGLHPHRQPLGPGVIS